MALLDRIEPDLRPRVVDAFIADAAARRARGVWLFAIAAVVVLWGAFLLWQDAFELFHFMFIAPVAVFGVGFVFLRSRGTQLPIALAGHGFSQAERDALCLELAADPNVRAAIAQRAGSMLSSEASRYGGRRARRRRR